jgi:hypothetical protein
VSVGAERVLTARELNRALLDRQLLLARRKLSPPQALERIGGLQAQYAPSMYVGLWTRLAGFERDSLTRALERRAVVQGTLQRATIHLVAAHDYWPFALAVREARREAWLKYHRGARERDVEAAARVARHRLAAGPATRRELGEGMDSVTFNGVGIWLDLVRVPPAGTWERRRADLYALARNWLGEPELTQADALRVVVDRYLRGFGPATAASVANWAGLPSRAIEAELERSELRHFRDERGALLFDLPRRSLPAADRDAPPRFLPTWDATLLAHARRAEVLGEDFRKLVFSTRTPQSVPTFAIDGVVAGKWRWERGKLELDPFRRLRRAERTQLEDEAERLAAFHA